MMRERCEVAGNCDERFAGWIEGSTVVPPHTRTLGMKSGGESGRSTAEPSIGFVTRTLFGMSGRMVSVLDSTSYMIKWLFATMNTFPSGRAKTLPEEIVSAL